MEYNEYIVQKHRLALALTILKTKPQHLTIHEYIGDIKRKIEINEEIDKEFEVSVSSDDFNINRADDAYNETQDVDFNYVGTEFNDAEIDSNLNLLTNTLPVTIGSGEQMVLPPQINTDVTNCESNINSDFIAPGQENIIYFAPGYESFNEPTSVNHEDVIIYSMPEFTASEVAQSQLEYIKIPRNYLINTNKRTNSEQFVRDKVKGIKEGSRNDSNKDCHKEIAMESKTSIAADSEKDIVKKYLLKIGVVDHVKANDESEQSEPMEDLYEIDNDYFNDRHDVSDGDCFVESNLNQKNSATQNYQGNMELLDSNVDTVFGQNSQFSAVDINKYVAQNLLVEDNTIETRGEAINFKVVEELNRLKTYLSKRQGAGNDSLDSGCKTYSLTNGSAWLNQSALTLINYIKTCPLLKANEEFRLEISQVLSELIESLNSEKLCPQFFDDLLEIVNVFINNIYEEKEQELLEKDDSITRLLLLNQSQHIIKYSIKKICDLLQVLSSEQEKSENLLEIVHIHKIENLAYIFFMLEQLLKTSKENQRLTKSVSQAISSLSQDKEKRQTSEGSSQIFDLRPCEKVLNNIILSNIEGYGLISFAALQCFNVIQS